jgi:hypothetical protein
MAIAYWAKKKELLAKVYAIRLEKMGKDHPATKDTKAEWNTLK